MSEATDAALSFAHQVALFVVACVVAALAGAASGLHRFHGTDGIAVLISMAFGAGLGLLAGLACGTAAVALCRPGRKLIAWGLSTLAAAGAGAALAAAVL